MIIILKKYFEYYYSGADFYTSLMFKDNISKNEQKNISQKILKVFEKTVAFISNNSLTINNTNEKLMVENLDDNQKDFLLKLSEIDFKFNPKVYLETVKDLKQTLEAQEVKSPTTFKYN